MTAPCMSACPTKLKIPKYIEEIAEGMPSNSLATIREDTCMAGTLGRVCVRPCESNCRRANVDESISIKYLKRFAADYELEKGSTPAVKKGADGTKKVAVLGAGPAGLSCAYYLGRMGCRRDHLRAPSRAGRHGGSRNPRLSPPEGGPRHRGRLVKDLGCEIRYNTVVGQGRDHTRAPQEFDAIFIGVGRPQ